MKEIVNYKPFDYQRDNINLLLDKTKNCGGCFIMDLTGLGKTVTSSTLAINLLDNPSILRFLIFICIHTIHRTFISFTIKPK